MCKVLVRSIVFSAFHANFCLCPKSVIITTLRIVFLFLHKNICCDLSLKPFHRDGSQQMFSWFLLGNMKNYPRIIPVTSHYLEHWKNLTIYIGPSLQQRHLFSNILTLNCICFIMNTFFEQHSYSMHIWMSWQEFCCNECHCKEGWLYYCFSCSDAPPYSSPFFTKGNNFVTACLQKETTLKLPIYKGKPLCNFLFTKGNNFVTSCLQRETTL